MTTSVLSPLAKPFEPTAWVMPPPAEFLICNNGIPECVFADETEIVRGVSDEAIEDCFPPTMEEMMEIEETEIFVQMLANLDLCEEREEKLREFADLKKRWDARRKEGIPVGGRPRRVKKVESKEDIVGVPMVNHNKVSTDIVSHNRAFSKFHHHGDNPVVNRSHRERSKKNNMPKRNFGGMHGYDRKIQQPRK